jgi:hypothetical protein
MRFFSTQTEFRRCKALPLSIQPRLSARTRLARVKGELIPRQATCAQARDFLLPLVLCVSVTSVSTFNDADVTMEDWT